MTSVSARRERVSGGSRRKRDLDAVAADRKRQAAEQRERILGATQRTDRSESVWEDALLALRAALPDLAYEIWLAPLALVGEAEGALVATCPATIRAHVARRYAPALGGWLRDDGRFRGVFVLSADAPVDEGWL